MYRILAVHCLVLSYMLSAMYSSGVKSGDTYVLCFFLPSEVLLHWRSPSCPRNHRQSTFAGLAVAGFFFVLSRSQVRHTALRWHGWSWLAHTPCTTV